MRIVICGDSFNTVDDRYPGLHWADRLAPHEVYRLARGGCSNFSIYHQVMQSSRFDPDVVLISFTNCPRIEFLASEPTFYSSLVEPWRKMVAKHSGYIKGMIKHEHKDIACFEDLEQQIQKDVSPVEHCMPNGNYHIFEQWFDKFYIESFDTLKNYLYITQTLQFLADTGCRHYASLGGIESFVGQTIQNVQIDFTKYQSVLVLPNAWKYPNRHHSEPIFHIKDADYHMNYATKLHALLADTTKDNNESTPATTGQ